jgi:hypothetical protein
MRATPTSDVFYRRKNMKHWIALLMLAAISSAGAQDVYKCPKDGKIVYSDKPCFAGAKPMDIEPPLGHDEGTMRRRAAEREKLRAEAYAKEQAEALEQNRRAREALEEERQREREAMIQERIRACGSPHLVKVQIGMTEKRVRECSDAKTPVNVNITRTASSESAQWVMSDFDRYRYIYFRNGRVSAIQE